VAKIEAWEERIRSDMMLFSDQLNGALAYARIVHESQRSKDPDSVQALDPEDPKWSEKLVPVAHTHALVSTVIKIIIKAMEDEDQDLIHRAMQKISEFTEGIQVSLQWNLSDGIYRLTRLYDPRNEPEKPFVTASVVFSLADYMGRYKDILELGVCRVCDNVYLKPKHGRKQRYCSRSCQQKAYRERLKEREG